MSSGVFPPPGVGLMVGGAGGSSGDMVVTDSFLRSIRGEGVAGLVGVSAGAGVDFDLVEDEEVGGWEGGGVGVGGYESDEGVDVGGDYDDVERLVMSSSSRAISGDMGIGARGRGIEGAFLTSF